MMLEAKTLVVQWCLPLAQWFLLPFFAGFSPVHHRHHVYRRSFAVQSEEHSEVNFRILATSNRFAGQLPSVPFIKNSKHEGNIDGLDICLDMFRWFRDGVRMGRAQDKITWLHSFMSPRLVQCLRFFCVKIRSSSTKIARHAVRLLGFRF